MAKGKGKGKGGRPKGEARLGKGVSERESGPLIRESSSYM